MKNLIIIPAYNESKCIEQTVADILKKAPEFDYVIINDCSTDETSEICHRNHFHIIDLPTNLGIGGAVQTGYLSRNGYDAAVCANQRGSTRSNCKLHYNALMQKERDMKLLIAIPAYCEDDSIECLSAEQLNQVNEVGAIL